MAPIAADWHDGQTSVLTSSSVQRVARVADDGLEVRHAQVGNLFDAQ